MSSSPVMQDKVFVGPGISTFKKTVTLLGVLGVVALVLWIALRQGSSAIGSTIVAFVFIVGFLYYLRIVAPVPFTIRVSPEVLVKRSANGEERTVRWEELARIKEEFFPNGKRISISAYRVVASPEQKAKLWAVYRDDLPDLDGLADAIKEHVPPTCTWQRETVHE